MSIFNRNPKNFAWSDQGESRPLVIITGYYGFDNLGDEAILEELLIELSTICPKQNIVVLSNNPLKTASLYQVNSFNRWHWTTYIHLLKRAKLLVSGGGGLFQDRTGLGSVIFYGMQILLARLFAVRTLIYAQGLGPLNSPFSRKLTQLALKQASTITLRDPLSISMAQDWNLPCRLTADSVWSLPASPLPTSIKDLIDKLRLVSSGQKNEGIIVGLSLRDDPALKEYHFELLANILSSVLPAQSTVLLLPLQPSSDYPVLKRIEKYLLKSKLRTDLISAAEILMPSQWLALMENLDLIIAMRFHALLMALKAAKPVIGIAYDTKVSILLKEFKQPLIPLDTEDRHACETIWSKTIKEALSNQKDLADLAKNRLALVKQLANENMNALAQTLEVATTGNVK